MSNLQETAKKLMEENPGFVHDDLSCCTRGWDAERGWRLLHYKVENMSPERLGKIVAESGSIQIKVMDKTEYEDLCVPGLKRLYDLDKETTMLSLLQYLATAALMREMVKVSHPNEPDEDDFILIIPRTTTKS